MADDHDLRSDCAVEFAKIKGDIEKVKNGQIERARVLEKLTVAVESGQTSNTRNHDETTRMITGFQSQLIEMFSRQSERLALVEQSDRAAHHRLDSQTKVVWGLVAALLAIAGTIIAAAALG